MPQQVDGDLIAALAEYVPQVMRVYGTPGLGIAVSRRGRVVWEAGFGTADLASGREYVATTTTKSGSMGKVYTATAVMQLVEEGHVDLDGPVNDYLDGLRVTNPHGPRDVTVRDLLTHRSGLAGNAAAPTLASPPPLKAHLAEVYAAGRNDFYNGSLTPMWSRPVGETYQYSNTGIATLGCIVEAVNSDRLSFPEYVQRRILDPLVMRSTQYPCVQDPAHVRPDLYSRLSAGYSQLGRAHIPTVGIYFGDYPAGGVVTTPGDHLRLLLAYQHRGTLDGQRILKPETVDLMLTPQHEIDADVQMGLVWWLFQHGAPEAFFGHSGAHMWGWTNTSRLYPHLDVGVVVCTNHWNLGEGPHHPRYPEGERISDFVATWLASDDRARQAKPARSWPWKVGYVAGLVVGDRLHGCLSLPPPLPAADLAQMSNGTVPGDVPFDPDGFRAGLNRVALADPTLDGIAALLGAPDLPVSPAELPLIFAELGQPTATPLLPAGGD